MSMDYNQVCIPYLRILKNTSDTIHNKKRDLCAFVKKNKKKHNIHER